MVSHMDQYLDHCSFLIYANDIVKCTEEDALMSLLAGHANSFVSQLIINTNYNRWKLTTDHHTQTGTKWKAKLLTQEGKLNL